GGVLRRRVEEAARRRDHGLVLRAGGRVQPDVETAIRQLVSKALVAEGIIDVFEVAGLKKPDISVLSDEFLDDLRNAEHKNLAAELLRKLLHDELKTRRRKN